MVMLILSFFVFLFCLYTVCRDDLVLLRRNITLEWLFNQAFLTIVIGLLSARLVYVFSYFDSQFLNPLIFVSFSHFPGLSLTGGILGGILYMLIFARKKKAPFKHILDAFSISIIASLLLGLVINIFSTKVSFKELTSPFLLVEFVIYMILFVAFFRLFQKARFKEGSIALLFLVFFSLLSFGWDILVKKSNILTGKAYEDYLLIVIFLISTFLFVKEEEFLKGLKLKKRVNRTLRKFEL